MIDGRLEDRFVERLIEAGEQPRAPILAQGGERAEEGVRSPVRDSGDDQMLRRGDASDRFAVVDMLRDQRAGDRANSDFVSAIPDSDGFPRPGDEKLVERRRV